MSAISTKVFQITMTNYAPYFADDKYPVNLTLRMNNTFEYKLPNYKDRENNPVFYILDSQPPLLLNFANIFDDAIIFKPT